MGKRIADQVRRALFAAAKVAPVVVVIDATGCEVSSGACASEEPIGAGGTWGRVTVDADAAPILFVPGGRTGTDAGDASKDGG